MSDTTASVSNPPDIRHRVTRLIAGDVRPDDIHRLLMWARSLPTGSITPAIRDVGDFIAHQDERDKGLAWATGRRFCTLTRLHLWKAESGVPATLNDLKEAQLAGPLMLPPDELMQKSKMSPRDAQRVMKNALAKIASFDGTNETFSQPLTKEEDTLYYYFRNMRSVPFAFTIYSLVATLADVFVAQGVLLPEERSAFMQLQCRIGVYAMSKMHRTRLDLGTLPGTACLEIGITSKHPDALCVLVLYDPGPTNRMLAMVRIVASCCKIRDWTVRELWPTSRGSIIETKDWSIPLDVRSDGKLAPFPGLTPEGPVGRMVRC